MHSLGKIQQSFQRALQSYNDNASIQQTIAQRLVALAIQAKLPTQANRVLEIGCGIGTDAQQFAQNGAHYVGIDLSNESLALSKQRFKVFELEGEFHNIDMTDLTALEKLGKFDLVYSYGVIHHFPNIEKIIANVHAILNTSGEFKFMVYAKNSWKYAMKKRLRSI